MAKSPVYAQGRGPRVIGESDPGYELILENVPTARVSLDAKTLDARLNKLMERWDKYGVLIASAKDV